MIYRSINNNIENREIYSEIISIEELVKEYLPEVNYTENLKKRSLDINSNKFLEEYFNEAEIKSLTGFTAFKRQIEWLAGRFVIKSIINKTKPEILSKNITINAKQGGSPYIDEYPDWNISISHSRGFAAGAVSYDKDTRIGIDLEKKGGEKSKEFKRLVFTDKEIDYLANKDTESLYESWCIKEAYLKLIEKGFAVSMKELEVFEKKIYIKDAEIRNIKVFTETFEDVFIFAMLIGH